MKYSGYSAVGIREWRVRVRLLGDAFLRRLGLSQADLLGLSFPPIPRHLPWFIESIMHRALGKSLIKSESLVNLKEGNQNGLPIYVLGERSIFDLFFLVTILRFQGQGVPQFAFGINLVWLLPLKQAFGQMLGQVIFWMTHGRWPHPVDDGFFHQVTSEKARVVLFLRQKLKWKNRNRRFAGRSRKIQGTPIQEYLHVLLKLQPRSPQAIHLLPFLVIWDAQISYLRKSFLEVSFLVRLFHLLFVTRITRFRPQVFFPAFTVLADLLKTTPKSGHNLIKDLRADLNERLATLELVVRGPTIFPRNRLLDRLSEDPAVRSAAERFGKKRNLSGHTVEKIARKYLAEMVGDYRPWALRFFLRVLNYVFQHNCSGVVYDWGQIDVLREAISKGSVILVPNHRSHLDYLLISYLLYRNQVMIPSICAGDNLNFWPAGAFFRRAGAFFIRRSFDETTLYPTVLRRYLRYLVHSRALQEVFMEGGRSRTGRMRPPMLGILSLMAQASLDTATDISFVPLALSYERIPEERSIVQELLGRRKKPERFLDLWKIWRLRKMSLGRIYLTLGKPLALSGYLRKDSFQEEKIPEHVRRKATSALAEDLNRNLQRGIILTPTGMLSLILLGIPQDQGFVISRHEIMEFSEVLLKAVELQDFSNSPRAFTVLESVESGMNRALKLFEAARLIDLQASTDAVRVRMEENEVAFCLDYYRNTVLHAFLMHSILARAMVATLGTPPHGQAQPSLGVPEECIRQKSRWLQDLLIHDFPAGGEFSFEKAMGDFVTWKILAKSASMVSLGGEWAQSQKRLLQFGSAVLGILEAHRAATRTVYHWTQGKEDFLAEVKEDVLIQRMIDTMGPSLRPESRSWFNLANALGYLVDQKMLFVRHERRGRAFFRRYSVEGWETAGRRKIAALDSSLLERHLKNLTQVC